MRTAILALWVAFIVSLLTGGWLIGRLRKLHVGQNVYELAPEEHRKKQGTPTMGGILFAVISVVLAFVFRKGGFDLRSDLTFAVIVFALLNMAIGFADDFTKLRRRNNKGLSEKQKLIGQFVITALFAYYCYRHPQVGSTIEFPFLGSTWELGWWYIPVMIFVLICTANGSNLLDGLDGLCGGVSCVVTGAYAVTALLLATALSGEEATSLRNIATLCAALCGSLLGYLRFNLHPARVMMGDTGSMFLGGIVGGAAAVMRMPWLIPVAAAGMAVSLLSVFLQRYYFKLTHGKRIFKMSPLHHHFELCGIPETKIVSMYVIVTVLLSLAAVAGAVWQIVG